MKIKKDGLSFIIYIIYIILILISFQLSFASYTFSKNIILNLEVLIIFLYLAKYYLFYDTKNPVSLVLLITSVFLFFYPSLAIFESRGLNIFYIVAIYLIFSDIMLSYFNYPKKINIVEEVSKPYKIKTIIFILISAFSGMFFPKSFVISLFTFIVPYSISFFYYESFLRAGGNKKTSKLIIFYYFVCVGFYLAFYWTGFGRLLVGIYILIPLLIHWYYFKRSINPFMLFFAAPVTLFISHMSRYGDLENFADVFIGSAGHHLIVTDDVFSIIYDININIKSFLDQYMLMFLNWFPREAWNSKPIGAGLSAVDTIYGRQNVDEGYSISLGFVGEQIYLLGVYFPFGLLLYLVTLTIVRKWLEINCNGYISILVLYDMNLISYIWGGGASFGSRVWFMIIPVLMLVKYFKNLKKSKSYVQN